MRQARQTAIAGALAAALAGGAAAQDGAAVEIEFNRLSPREGACEAYLVVRNPGAAELDMLRLDLVLFDDADVIARRLAVEAGPVRPDKTSVRAFLVDGLACDSIGSMLLNEVVACADASGPRANCLDALRVSARPGLVFTR